jgi:hypothetical protein
MNEHSIEDFGLLVIIILAATVTMVGWYKVYVEPSDAIAMEIISCMGDDDSPESYEECRRKTIAGGPNFQSRD